jgi:hypothetical protein
LNEPYRGTPGTIDGGSVGVVVGVAGAAGAALLLDGSGGRPGIGGSPGVSLVLDAGFTACVVAGAAVSLAPLVAAAGALPADVVGIVAGAFGALGGVTVGAIGGVTVGAAVGDVGTAPCGSRFGGVALGVMPGKGSPCSTPGGTVPCGMTP